MPGLGSGHFFYLIIFLCIVLVIFGPGKLPEVGSGLGRAIREFRRATSDVTDAMKTHDAPPGPAPAATVAVPPPEAAPSVAAAPPVVMPDASAQAPISGDGRPAG